MEGISFRVFFMQSMNAAPSSRLKLRNLKLEGSLGRFQVVTGEQLRFGGKRMNLRRVRSNGIFV